MGLFETATRLSTLAVGRRPEWETQAALTTPPASLGAGVAMRDAARALVGISLRADPSRRTARIRITAADAATTYAIVVGGTSVDTTSQATIENVVQELEGALNASAPIVALVSVSTESSDGVIVDTIVLTGLGVDDYTITATATGGTGTLTLTADATTCDARLWVLPRGTGAPGWVLARDGDLGTLTTAGMLERIDCAGLERAAVQIVDADGAVTVRIGPCLEEG